LLPATFSDSRSCPMPLSRRSILGSAAAMIAAPAVAQECRLGSPEHHKGPNVFLDYDQLELDAA
jgi:arylformamidase